MEFDVTNSFFFLSVNFFLINGRNPNATKPNRLTYTKLFWTVKERVNNLDHMFNQWTCIKKRDNPLTPETEKWHDIPPPTAEKISEENRPTGAVFKVLIVHHLRFKK